MTAAKAVRAVRARVVRVLSRHPHPVPAREDVTDHVLAEAVEEAVGRVHVRQWPCRHVVLRERHVLRPERAAPVREREHLSRQRDELAVADLERPDLGLHLVARRGAVGGRRKLDRAVVRVAGPLGEDATRSACREQRVRERDACVTACSPKFIRLRRLGGAQRMLDRSRELLAERAGLAVVGKRRR